MVQTPVCSRIAAKIRHGKPDLRPSRPAGGEDTVGDKAAERPIEVWFADEARVGQKGQLTRQWAKKGSRPRQPKDQRHKAAYLFAAACPETNSAAALVLPKANTHAMNLHLAEISSQVTPGAYAVVILDRAGWHVAHDLDVPDNISLLFLPPYSPELNPIENLFQFIKHNFLNARVYETYEDIVDACCFAWKSLIKIKGKLQSITSRTWAKTVNV